MTLSAENAMRQAHLTARDYAMWSVTDLCEILDIDQREPGWRTALAPFAPVLAGMITAAAMDYDTAAKGGVVNGAARPANGDGA
jgi:hypothetical protein